MSYSATDYRLILTSQQEGAAGFDLQPEGSPDLVAAFGFIEIQSGLNAQLKVDRISLTRSSNTISDVFSGITLNLKKAEVGTTITLNINRDAAGVSELIKEFAAKYDEVMNFIRAQSSFDSINKKTGGVLFGEGTLNSVKSDLVNNIINSVSGVSSQFSILGQIGMSLDKEGKLSIDEDALKEYLETNPEDVMNLFVGNGPTNTNTVNYIAHGLKNRPGTYVINITDTFKGYVSFKQTSLQDRIKRFDTQVSEMEARLDKRREKTLSQLQSMSNWLSSQINTLIA